MRVTFDIETNDIHDWLNLSDMKTILCFVVQVDDQEPQSLNPKDAIKVLMQADTIVGHNILGFDIPAIQRLYPEFKPAQASICDTLVLARLFHPDQREKDFGLPEMPKELVGSHSLKAWGYRLGISKAEAPAFDRVTDDLIEYCKQDVRVTNTLYKHLMNNKAWVGAEDARALERDFAIVIKQQERYGFPFNVEAAQALHSTLRGRLLELEAKMQQVFPPKVIPRVSEKTGKPLKPKTEIFNPGSRVQIAERLKERYKWEPKEFTPDGRPRVDESVLASLDYPEAAVLAEYLNTVKRLGQLADGDEAWMKVVGSDGRIHGRVNTNGAITGRCTHSRPNMAQVPAESAYRSLFYAGAGRKMVGADASGLELRCLAHFLGKFDKGVYAKQILEGDIHWANSKAFGLTTDTFDASNPEHKKIRNQAKGAIYALIYGAGDEKLGFVLGGDKKRGRKARDNFIARVPAYGLLRDYVASSLASKGYLRGLDGRPLMPRSEHAALNTLLQSAGAVVMKRACVIAHREFAYNRLDVHQVASIHDEYQFSSHPDCAEMVGKIVVQAITQAGEDFKFRCRLDGEYRVGDNWAETH